MLKTPTRDVRVRSTEPLITPAELIAELPMTSEVEQHVLGGRDQVERVIEGADSRLMVIVGPCSIHDSRAAFEYDGRLKDLAGKLSDKLLVVMRVYFEKPRTTVGWKGLIYDPDLDDTFDILTGLRRARRLLLDLAEMDVYVGTEFLDPIVPQYIAGLVSWAAIGARTIESQIHRQMASGLSMPIGFKNATDGSPQTAIDAMISARLPQDFLGIDRDGRSSIVRTGGNPYCHLALKGGKHGPNYGRDAVAEANAWLRARARSHANSGKDHTRQGAAFRDVVGQRAAGNGNVIGCMLESNLMVGSQKLNGDASKLMYGGVSITDACIGWPETEQLLTWAHDQLG